MIKPPNIESCDACGSAIYVHAPDCNKRCDHYCRGYTEGDKIDGFKLADKHRAVNGQFGCEDCREDL